jgi:hypothetical protein
MNLANFSMTHVYALLGLAFVAYWLYADPAKRTKIQMGVVTLPQMITTAITTGIQPALIVLSIAMGIMISANLHNLSVTTIDAFGKHIPEMSLWMGICLDIGITLLGVFSPILLLVAVDITDANGDYHEDSWAVQIAAFNKGVAYNSGNADVKERLYEAWGMYRNPKTKKLTPIAKLHLLYLLIVVTAIVAYTTEYLSIFGIFSVGILAFPVGITTFSYFTYHAHGTREKLVFGLIIVSLILALLYGIVAYFFYQYLYLFPYQTMITNPTLVAKYYLGEGNNGIVNGVLTPAGAKALLGQLDLTLKSGFLSQISMLLLDTAAGVFAVLLGGGAGLMKLISTSEKVGAFLTNQSFERTMDEANEIPEPKQKTENTGRNNSSSNNTSKGEGNNNNKSKPTPEEDEDLDPNM